MIFALFGILAILSSRRSAICVRLLGVVGCHRGLLVTFDSRRGRAHVEHVVPLQRRRIPARTRLSDICGAIAGEERMAGSGQARSKVCHEPCHRSMVRSLPRRAGVCPKASWSVWLAWMLPMTPAVAPMTPGGTVFSALCGSLYRSR